MSHLRRSLTLALAGLMLVPATAAAATSKPKAKTVDVTVMTRNLYLGGDIITLAAASSQADFEQRATALFQRVQQTDFDARASLIADEIRRTKPDLIGLQEVALWRRGADGVKDGAQTPATTVVYDWLDSLDRELDERGLNYRVVEVQDELDVEGPTSQGYDVRFTQRDAILVRVDKRIKVRNAKGSNFVARMEIPTQIGDVNVLRGWVQTDATVRGAKLRFVNTHLEAYSEEVGTAQAKELIARRGPARTSTQTVITGDFNSSPVGAKTQAARALLGFGFDDTFFRKTRTRPGTCCQAEDLLNPQSQLESYIDMILAKPRVTVSKAQIVGNDPTVRTPAGLWPSDHAGVVTTLRVPVKK